MSYVIAYRQMKGKIGTGKRVKQVLDWNRFYFVFQYFVYLLFSDPSFTNSHAMLQLTMLP